MRKNGINRALTPIEGGVCAPEGFKANAVCCGFDNGQTEKDDLAIIVADKRCPIACVYSDCAIKGAPATVTKRHIKTGLGQAVLINSGIANVYMQDGEKLAEAVCRLAWKRVGIDWQDIVIASTGRTDGKLTLKQFESNIGNLKIGIEASNEKSLAAARAIMTTDKQIKQISYSFELGAFRCKIGAIFKGSAHVAPNMSTVLGVITTDVNISHEMLQRALSAEVKDTFNLLNVDGLASPNDMICIMANGKAGNCRIDYVDTEYSKFAYILGSVLANMCKMIAQDGIHGNKLLSCRVMGVKSKQVSRAISKNVVGCHTVKLGIAQGIVDISGILGAIANVAVEIDISALCVKIRTQKGEIAAFEEGVNVAFSKERAYEILQEKEVELLLDFGKGNYSSVAYGCDFSCDEKKSIV